MTSLTKEAAAPLGVKPRDADRSKNFFALGLVSWLYSRPTEPTLAVDRGALRRQRARARRQPCRVPGRATTSARPPSCSTTATRCGRRRCRPGEYTNITGNTALAWGLVAAGQLAQLPVPLGSYPITPASDILHELSKHKNFGVRTVQAEDEIAACGIGARRRLRGPPRRHHHERPRRGPQERDHEPRRRLELPLVLVDIQRGGPSTGLPTKTEAADLNIAMYRPPRRGAAADRRRLQPVALLLRGHRGGPHRPQVPHAGDPAVRRLPGQRRRAVAAPRRRPTCPTSRCRSPASPTTWPPTARLSSGRTCATRTRWPAPGRSRARRDSTHRVGGLEKEDGTGNIDYTPENHERMVHLRAAKVAGIANDIPPPTVIGDDDADLLVLGWGSTWAAIDAAVQRTRARRPARSPGPTSCTSTRCRPTSATCCSATRRSSCPSSTWASCARSCGPSTSSTPNRSARCRACRSPPPRSSRHRERSIAGGVCSMTDTVPLTTKKDWTSDQEVRWCPGCGDYGILLAVQMLMPELGVKPGEHRVRLRHRLLEPVPVLHEHLRHPQHPRSRPGHRHRAGGRPPRPRRVGDHRRRRRPVDRRQPPHPRAAPQRRTSRSCCSTTRSTGSPRASTRRPRSSARSRSRRRSVRSTPPFNPLSVALGAEATFVARTHDLDREAHDRDVPGRPRPPRRVVRRDLPELQRLQRRRLRDDHRQGGAPRHADRPRARPADPLRCRPEKGVVDAHRRPARDRRGGRRRARTPSSSTTSIVTIRAWPSHWRGCRTRSTSPHRSACSVTSTAPSTRPR